MSPVALQVIPLVTGGPEDARWSLSLRDSPAGFPGAVSLGAGSIDARVPGCVHTDLIEAGQLADPYLGTNELSGHWVGRCDWRYTGRFDVMPDLMGRQRVDVVFDGIDTVATVFLNDREVGRVDNMHATWRFDVRETLRRGANVLELDFPSPLTLAESELARYQSEIGDFPRAGAGANPQLAHHMLRKMHCNFGWDWGPQLVTCGIWRPVRLEAWDVARIAAVRPQVVAVSAAQAVLEVPVDIERATGEPLTLQLELFDPEGQSAGREAVDVDGGAARLVVRNPQRWWPAGHGPQPLYDLVVTLHQTGGRLLGRSHRKVGLRVIELVTTRDESPAVVAGAEQPKGATFHLRVNGRRIFCKGANWIPDDCFPHRVTPERYRRRVQQARDANMNMLRVWGGGIYEDEAFYDACDDLGLLVWQDFPTACACYPEDETFKGRFEKEARDNIARLAGRASLALWCGGNESLLATFDWGPEFRKMRDAAYGWGLHYWYEVFPRLVAELAPQTPYWANSPASGADRVPANAEHVGDQHIWDVWNGHGDWRNYWSHVPRFASEFGFHGPPTWPTLEQAIPADQRNWFSRAMVLHNKQEAGQERAIDRGRDHFTLPPEPDSTGSFERMWFVAALNQARALKAGCEWFRALSPWCGGALYWQLNDCWPVASWSAIDNDTAGAGRPKLLWNATRRFFAPRLCALLPSTVTPVGHEPAWPRVTLHNEHPEAWSGTLSLKLLDFTGRLLEHEEAIYTVEPGGILRYIVPGHWAGAPDRLITAEASGAPRATWFFGRDMDLPYPQPRFDVEISRAGGATQVCVTARTLLRDLCLLAERIDSAAEASDQLLTLLPRETACFHLSGERPITADELATAWWSANLFGGGTSGG